MFGRTTEASGASTIQLLIAFAGGTAVGAALGVLLAPSSGEETRRRIKGMITARSRVTARVPHALSEAAAAALETFAAALRGPEHHDAEIGAEAASMQAH